MNQRKIFPITASLILAIAVICAAAPGYSFNLAQMLGAGDKQEFRTFKVIHTADLKALLATGGDKIHIFDANVPETRARFGIIPGATLLPSDNYNLALLPTGKDLKLVFYCANTQCMASHEAARRAVAAGYTDVSVMVDGIAGWKMARQPTIPAPGGGNS